MKWFDLNLKQLVVALVSFQLALGPSLLAQEAPKAAEPNPQPSAESAEAMAKRIQDQLNPPPGKMGTPSERQKTATSFLKEERRKGQAAKDKALGIDPTQKQTNQTPEAFRSHMSFFRDITQPRYRNTALLLTALDAAAVTTYFIYVHRIKQFWLPRFETIESLRLGIAESKKAFEAAESTVANTLVKNWRTLSAEDQNLFKETLDPSLRARVLNELSEQELAKLPASDAAATLNSKPPVVTEPKPLSPLPGQKPGAVTVETPSTISGPKPLPPTLPVANVTNAEEQVVQQAASIDDAMKGLVDATRRLVRDIEGRIKNLESGILEKASIEGAEGTAKTFNLRAAFVNEIKGLKEIDSTLSRPTSFAYYFQSRHLHATVLPQLEEYVQFALESDIPAVQESGKKISAAVSEYGKTEEAFRLSIIKNYDSLTVDQKALYSVSMSTEAQQEIRRALKAQMDTLSATEREAIVAAKVEDAYQAMIRANRDLSKVLRSELPRNFGSKGLETLRKNIPAEKAKLEDFRATLSDGEAIATQETKVEALQRQLAICENVAPNKELASSLAATERKLGTSFNRLSTMKEQIGELKTLSHSFLRERINGFENSLEAMRQEAGLGARAIKAERGTLKWWGPKIGLAVLVAIPVAVYWMQRSHFMEREAQNTLALTRSMNQVPDSDVQKTLNEVFSADGLPFQYSAFHEAWTSHPRLGRAGITCPLPAPEPSEAMNPALWHTFLATMTTATVLVQDEIDSDNKNVPEGETKLSRDERVYRKAWRLIFDEARKPGGNARIALIKERGTSSPTYAPGKTPPMYLEDLIADLADTVNRMPVEAPKKREIIKTITKEKSEKDKEDTKEEDKAEGAAGEILIDPEAEAAAKAALDAMDAGGAGEGTAPTPE